MIILIGSFFFFFLKDFNQSPKNTFYSVKVAVKSENDLKSFKKKKKSEIENDNKFDTRRRRRRSSDGDGDERRWDRCPRTQSSCSCSRSLQSISRLRLRPWFVCLPSVVIWTQKLLVYRLILVFWCLNTLCEWMCIWKKSNLVEFCCGCLQSICIRKYYNKLLNSSWLLDSVWVCENA